MAREYILHRIRAALGRHVDQPPGDPPPARLSVLQMDTDARIESFRTRLEALTGKFYHAPSAAHARGYVAEAIGSETAVAANDPFLIECGITALPNVRSGFLDGEQVRRACATARLGITSADYCLADTGTLVLFSSHDEARLISLLPPVHLAVVPRGRMLTSLDELLTLVPLPAERSSSLVLITGPSRTGDIEQFLVRGVHGPGEIHVIVV